MRAKRWNRVRVVLVLLDGGARVETANEQGCTALMIAACYNRWVNSYCCITHSTLSSPYFLVDTAIQPALLTLITDIHHTLLTLSTAIQPALLMQITVIHHTLLTLSTVIQQTLAGAFSGRSRCQRRCPE